jgi:hypothetical protein
MEDARNVAITIVTSKKLKLPPVFNKTMAIGGAS